MHECIFGGRSTFDIISIAPFNPEVSFVMRSTPKSSSFRRPRHWQPTLSPRGALSIPSGRCGRSGVAPALTHHEDHDEDDVGEQTQAQVDDGIDTQSWQLRHPRAKGDEQHPAIHVMTPISSSQHHNKSKLLSNIERYILNRLQLSLKKRAKITTWNQIHWIFLLHLYLK